MKRLSMPLLVVAMLILAVLACTRPGPSKRVYITATFPGGVRPPTDTPSGPTQTPIQPTPNPARFDATATRPSAEGGEYTVQSGDTLAVIALRFGVTVDDLLAVNDIANPDILEIGQVLVIPAGSVTPVVADEAPVGSFKMIPDSELVYGPTTVGFDVAAYVKLKPGFLRVYSEEINEELWSGVEIINKVALDHSVNPRLLLALLEYESGWLSNPDPSEDSRNYPFGIISINQIGLYRQLLVVADVLNTGYYGWKYRGLETAAFADQTPLIFASDINAGTVALQYFFARYGTFAEWRIDVSERGFFQSYLGLFGDPFRSAIDPVVPADLEQPALTFPFAPGETWYYTGGPHGGYNSGSAWSSIDFAPPAPPDELIAREGFCYTSPNWVTAVAPGVIVRSGEGYVILDLDFDGNEHTGWTMVYLHVSSDGVIEAGTRVQTGDQLGHPSCEGGVSTATHLHFGRRYNGEWIPVTCDRCPKGVSVPSFVMAEWTVFGYPGAEYQGYMINNKTQAERSASQGRTNPINHVSY